MSLTLTSTNLINCLSSLEENYKIAATSESCIRRNLQIDLYTFSFKINPQYQYKKTFAVDERYRSVICSILNAAAKSSNGDSRLKEIAFETSSGAIVALVESSKFGDWKKVVLSKRQFKNFLASIIASVKKVADRNIWQIKDNKAELTGCNDCDFAIVDAYLEKGCEDFLVCRKPQLAVKLTAEGKMILSSTNASEILSKKALESFFNLIQIKNKIPSLKNFATKRVIETHRNFDTFKEIIPNETYQLLKNFQEEREALMTQECLKVHRSFSSWKIPNFLAFLASFITSSHLERQDDVLTIVQGRP